MDSSSPDPTAALEQALQQFLGGDLADAERLCRDAAVGAPDVAAMRDNLLGHILAAQDRLPEAVECMRRALQQTPDNAGGQFNLGTALARLRAWSA